jgi:hypothetical protein
MARKHSPIRRRAQSDVKEKAVRRLPDGFWL